MSSAPIRALTVAVAVALLTPAAAHASDITPRSLVDTINAYRKVVGLGPYVIDPRLMEAAEDRMRHMEEQGYWAHNAPDGTPPFVWVDKHGFRYSMAGENLAVGFETVELLVDSWMQSEGHRANVVSPVYTSVGIAIIDGHVTGRMIGKSVVMLFAREMVERVPRR